MGKVGRTGKLMTLAPFISRALFVAFSTSVFWAESYKEKYSPYHDGYPQIIQKTDYPTINFIETLYSKLHLAAAADAKVTFGQTIDSELGPDGLRFHPKNEKSNVVLLKKTDEQVILVNNQRFAEKATVLFYSALVSIVADFTQEFGKCQQVRFVQFGTRAYKKRTVIEFDFGQKIVAVDSDASDPQSDERLYILDVIDRDHSMFGRSATVEKDATTNPNRGSPIAWIAASEFPASQGWLRFQAL